MIKKYRKRPLEVEAFQWDGKDLMELNHFVEPSIIVDHGAIYIPTLEGNMKVSADDYIVKGVNGEFYPCKPDIFEKTYEIVKDNEEKNL